MATKSEGLCEQFRLGLVEKIEAWAKNYHDPDEPLVAMFASDGGKNGMTRRDLAAAVRDQTPFGLRYTIRCLALTKGNIEEVSLQIMDLAYTEVAS